MKPPTDSTYDTEYRLAQRAIRVLLTPLTPGDLPQPLPGTHEKIYNACRSAVCAARKAEGLYDHFKQELDRCVGTIANMLTMDKTEGVQWLGVFNAICKWFESQVVRKP